jgi:hypothetical protein
MQQSMFIYSTDWYGKKTFRMLPNSINCPFNEVIYDPGTKVLAIISKEHKEKPQMFPKLNEKGELVQKKGATGADGKPLHVEERRMMDTYYEYYIDNIDDIKEFINFFANNAKHQALAILEK